MTTQMTKRRLRKCVTAFCISVMVMLCASCTCFIEPDRVIYAKETQTATNYYNYSNVKKSWFIKRMKEHQPSLGAQTEEELKKYRAYYYDAEATENVIYFTFDCGYENGYTGKLLDILKKYDAKAVFFVTKHFVKTQPELCKRMKEEGHLVGNHTMNHPSLPERSVTQIQNELSGLEQLFKEYTGYQMDKFLRPPMGEYSDRVLKVAKDMGYTTVFWSIAYADYDPQNQPGKQYVIDHFKNYHHKGAITLTHNVSKSNTEALPQVLRDLKQQGYRFVRIDELGQPKNQKVAVPTWAKKSAVKISENQSYVPITFLIRTKKDLQPEGYEVYRKEKGGKYELIVQKRLTKAQLKKSVLSITYKDRTIDSEKTYFYKVKTYCYKYGRKFVSTTNKSWKVTV